MRHTWLTYSFVFTQALLATAGEFHGVDVSDHNQRDDGLVSSLDKRSVAADANKRVRRGILDAAKVAKDMTTAAIRGVMVVKDKIRALKGEDDDEPFDPINVNAILKAEGYNDEPSIQHNTEDASVPLSPNTPFHQTTFHPRMNPYNEGHMEGMESEEFYKGQ
ncbi:uncharacterized protein LOC119390836 [Rhipicephalus sanguineus]|uniref:uncharacterized protein LOC119390836 n=1 Tax=Rhipicephalus sanguineus TaxID=34632 RepID=UPI0018930481|nr:uncharacterized protein LOC119390836 [Rhipicephalus sanguineus]